MVEVEGLRPSFFPFLPEPEFLNWISPWNILVKGGRVCNRPGPKQGV